MQFLSHRNKNFGEAAAHFEKCKSSYLWKQSDILSRHGREVLQGPRRAQLHFKPLTLPQPQKWMWPQVQILSKVTAEAAAASSYTFKELGAAAPVEDPPSCKLQPWPHTTAAFQQILRPNGEKKELLAASSIFFLIKLYCLRKGDRTKLAHAPQRSSDGWRILSEVFPIDECHKLTSHQDSVV